MLDRDLADLYGVETRVLKQAVRRNINRFPIDFMFEMSKDELENWRSQIVMSNQDKLGLRHQPVCFTEMGVAMLSSVLKSERSITMNIHIMRVYSKMREMFQSHKDLIVKIEELDKQMGHQDKRINQIFEYLKQLIQEPPQPRPQIGYNKRN